jgi:carbonic anhydrase
LHTELQVAVCDTTSVFVQWAGQATNLGEFHSHRPSFHNSKISGITTFKFNKDRSKITEVSGVLFHRGRSQMQFERVGLLFSRTTMNATTLMLKTQPRALLQL